MYRAMVQNRILDDALTGMQERGDLRFFLSSTGEEATHVGSAYALRPTDWIFPGYRELGAALVRGFSIQDLVNQLFGNSEDLTKGRQLPNHICGRYVNFLSVSGPVATQLPHAVGAAWAARLVGDDTVVLAYFGEGATSQGDFHVAMNIAGIHGLPVVFLCRNNRWGISAGRARQTASETFATKAKGYGMPGLLVDGNDVLAVHEATRRAVEGARKGKGPTFIESVTFRREPHDKDPKDRESARWQRVDPIRRFRKFLLGTGRWDEHRDGELHEELRSEIIEALEHASRASAPRVETMFDDVYERVPRALAEDRQSLNGGSKGGT